MVRAVMISDEKSSSEALLIKDVSIERTIFTRRANIFIRSIPDNFVLETPFNPIQFSNPRNIMNNVDVWIDFLNKYKHLFIDNDIILLQNDSDLRYLAMYISKLFGIPIFLIVNKVSPISSYDYPLYLSSELLIYKNEKDINYHTKFFPFSSRRVVASDISKVQIDEVIKNINNGGMLNLKKCHSGNFDDMAIDHMRNILDGKKDISLLIVSYFAGDAKAVGVFRVNYWASHIYELSGGKINVDLATASYISEGFYPENATIHHIKDFHVLNLLSHEKMEPWKINAIQEEIDMSKSFSTLSFYWRFALEKYFSERNLYYDVVLFTGNPFPFFEFSKFCKRRWYSKVIYDYRDPFALNPRMKYSNEQRKRACNYERRLNFVADKIITVNKMCAKLICTKDRKVEVIENGFDESIVSLDKPSSDAKLKYKKIKFVYSGKLAHDRDLSLFVNLLDLNKHEFHFIGDDQGYFEGSSINFIVNHGLVSYGRNIEILKNMHCGIVLMSEHQFETPTKIYEYIAMGLDIVFIVNSNCDISPDFKDYVDSIGGCHVLKNNKREISRFLKKYKYSVFDRDKRIYSRKYHAIKLIELILGIVD